jgi:polar amino acid transport system permease protein
MIVAVVIATVAAIAAISPARPVRWAAIGYIDLFRAIPILALLIFIYFAAGPLLVRARINPLWLAGVTLGVGEGAYLGEIYRSGLRAVPGMQWDAASSLGFRWVQTVRLVILPQAVGPAIPSTLNMLISIIKDSALASLIAIAELTQHAQLLVSITFEPMKVYIVLSVVYLAMIIPLTIMTAWLERRFGRYKGSRRERSSGLSWVRSVAVRGGMGR